jgi:hypothetical protein
MAQELKSATAVLEEEKMTGREEKLFYALQRLSEPYIETYNDYGEVEELHSKPLTYDEAMKIIKELVDPEHLTEQDLKEMIKISVAHFGKGKLLPFCHKNDYDEFQKQERKVSLNNFFEENI